MNYSELASLSREALLKEPCECVSCGTCSGTGRLSLPANHPDFGDTLTCDNCRGGIIETCERCRLLDEMEESE